MPNLEHAQPPRTTRRRAVPVARPAAGLLACALLACTPPDPDAIGPYEAEIRWDSWGVPHISAEDLPSAAYALGWAQARDHGCTLLDQVVMANSERSKYFGPGTDDRHVDSDFGWLALDIRGYAERGFPELDEVPRRALIAFAAGVSDAIEGGRLPAACAEEPWAQPIDHLDLLTYYVALAEFGSGAVLREALARAEPPDGRRDADPPYGFDEVARRLKDSPLGSNGWAIGRDLSEGGGGMLLANPHFPHLGERRWYEFGIRVPEQADVHGAGLIGATIVNIGFNRDLAWTHTVSSAPRFAIYRLELDPDDPTRYLHEGEYRSMTSRDFTVEVLQPDGTLRPESRTLWRSHHGPIGILDPAVWTSAAAYAVADVNEGNLAVVTTWLAMNQASDLGEFEAALAAEQGIPWVYTMATNADGDALFVDPAATPYLDAEAKQAYDAYLESSSLARTAASAGALLLDGSDPAFDLEVVAGTRKPGLVPYELAPRLLRSDFVANANDSHWLSNPAEPLEGELWVYGSERTPRSPRTRMNLRYLMDGQAAGADGRFSLAELEDAALSGRGLLADELLDDVVAWCAGMQSVQIEVDGEPTEVDVQEACAALQDWDGLAGTTSQGAVLWREFVSAEVFATADWIDAGALWSAPFDPDDPVATPSGLAIGSPLAEALAHATHAVSEAGLDPDVALGDAQWMPKDGERIPTFGGSGQEGLIAIATTANGDGTLAEPPADRSLPLVHGRTGLREGGYPILYGNSFVMALEFRDGAPRARAILTYSQSADPDSPHYADQSAHYAGQQMRDVLYEEEDILADPGLVTEAVSHPGPR